MSIFSSYLKFSLRFLLLSLFILLTFVSTFFSARHYHSRTFFGTSFEDFVFGHKKRGTWNKPYSPAKYVKTLNTNYLLRSANSFIVTFSTSGFICSLSNAYNLSLYKRSYICPELSLLPAMFRAVVSKRSL